jgi:hypothetical protein
MLDFLKSLFGVKAKPVETEPVNQTAPYKVPEPAATTPIPLVVEMVPAGTEASVAAPTKAKAPAKPKAPAKAKATTEKAPAKTPTKAKAPRAPRAPKAQS